MVVVGFIVLGKEEFTPAQSASVATFFPQETSIHRAFDKPTLLIFVHPLCPCTRATFHELGELLAELPDRLSVVLVFTIPDGLPTGWEKEDLWQSATSLPGVRLWRDEGGVEARRFGVRGSGHALLYDVSGRLLFSGGITLSRGHEGDNPGLLAIVDFVQHGHASTTHTPVFGCSLL